jgi:hypothetical protein
MNDTFWIGVFPGLGVEQLDHVIESFHEAYAASRAPRIQTG